MTKIILAALSIAYAAAAPAGGYCHTSWWPATCGLISDGNCIGNEYPAGGYATQLECETGVANPTPAPVNNGYCHTAWWPEACGLIADGGCIGSEYPAGGFASEADCLSTVASSASATGYCHTSWWPATCGLIADGGCVGTEYPDGGYATENDCLGIATGSGYCHTSWWPVACGLISDGACVGTEYPAGGYATEDDCLAVGGPVVTPPPTGTGYCHTAWFPEACGLIADGGCIGNEFPEGGFASEAECMTTGTAVDSSYYCITAWWPKTCGVIADSTCLTSDSFATNDDCIGDAQTFNQNDDGYCVTSWYPMECGLISGGACIGWYPPNGWVDSASCMGTNKAIAASLLKQLKHFKKH